MTSFERVLAALERARVRYLVAGGLAVVLHGWPRLTADLDLVVDFAESNVARLKRALARLGYRPRSPVDAMDLASACQRRRWRVEKGALVFALVFSLASVRAQDPVIDVFLEHPLPWSRLWRNAARKRLGEVGVRVVGRSDLMAIKRAAGRELDLKDVDALARMGRPRGGGSAHAAKAKPRKPRKPR